ncbi:hypothetical protein [Devosia sp.]|uniref:hypothetical protein n=1 Tax=Devosia sp. TaxID=1871048 RepID=UPI003265C114
MSENLRFVAESSVVSIAVITFLAGLFIVYLRFGRVIERRISLWHDLDDLNSSQWFQVGALIVTVILTELIALVVSWRFEAFVTFLVLVVGLSLSAVLYFTRITKLIEDNAVRQAIIMWLAAVLATMSILLTVVGLQFRTSLGAPGFNADKIIAFAGPVSQFIGILIAAVMVVLSNRFSADQAARAKGQETYQGLEFASVELFRFDIANPELVEALWFPTLQDGLYHPPADKIQKHMLEQYICQILNLFEMAYRFRKENIVPHDVYASWIIWMYELCEAEAFQHFWHDEEIAPHYIEDFRKLMNYGIEINRLAGLPDEDDPKYQPLWYVRADAFYRAAAYSISPEEPCTSAADWLRKGELVDGPEADAWFKREGLCMLTKFKGRQIKPAL